MRAPALLLLGLALGCSETNLRQVAPSLEAPGRPEGTPPPQPSPWDDWEGAELPQERWLLGWSEAGCVTCAPRLDVVDVLGRSLLALPLPPWGDLGPEHYELVDLSVAASGVAYASVQGATPEALAQPVTRLVHRVDAVQGHVDPVLAAGFPDRLVRADGEALPLDHALHSLLVAGDEGDADVLWVLAAELADARLVGTLLRVPVAGDEAVRRWALDELVDAEPVRLWGLTVHADRLALGVTVRAQAGNEAQLRVGRLEALPLRTELRLQGLDLPRARISAQPVSVLPRPAAASCWDGPYRIVTAARSWEFEPPAGCPGALALLDAEAPTYLHRGPAAEGDSLRVTHRGDDVAGFDRIGVGLSDLPFWLHEAAPLQLP